MNEYIESLRETQDADIKKLICVVDLMSTVLATQLGENMVNAIVTEGLNRG